MPRTLRAILFDLDNTLYDARAGLQDAVDKRITQWIMEQLKLSHEVADALRVRTWQEYGTTAKGLEAEYGCAPAPLYDWAVSRLEPGHYLRPWPALAAMLGRLRAECHVFTNATRVYAVKVLAALGVSQYFHCVFDIEHNGWTCKPHRPLYEGIVRELGVPATEIAFIEDNPRNLPPAAELGMLTVLLGTDEDGFVPDLRLDSILQLADALAEAGISA